MIKREDFECSNCGFVHENVWIEVKHRGQLYCPKCKENPEISRAGARM